ncbi:MAG TPA: multidrug effflux MFS transporter [Novosphingobium sp.]|nr:multidrug effflux MFS transporter [Novosphingobium sp.]
MRPPSLPTRQPAALSEGEFIFMMAMLMALQALCIDAMLPALGAIAGDLGVTDPNRRQLVVGVYLFASGIGALFPGALADRFGRRPVLLCSLAIYLLLALGCALVTDFTVLLVLRALQALGSAGLSVLPQAIIRDRFGGDRMARMLSTVSMVFMVVPILAPSLGQMILLFASWRWIFGGMAVLALVMAGWTWFRLPETLHPEYRQTIAPRDIVRNMGAAAMNRAAFGYVVGSALVTGAMFGYINSAQQLVAEHFGAGKLFPLLFGASAVMLAIASFANSRIVERFGARRVSHTALLTYLAASALQIYLAHSPHQTLWSFMPLISVNILLLGFIGANFGSIALQPFARIAGAASSLQAFVRMVVGGTIGAIIGQAFDNSARPLAFGLLVCALASLSLVLFSERGRLFRRLHPPGTPRLQPDAM